MIREDKITARQLSAMMFVGLMSPAIRLLPLRSVQFADSAAWVAVLIALPVSLGFVCLMMHFSKNCAEGEGLSDMIVKSVGEKGGKVVLALFALWFILYSGFILRSAAERLLASVYARGGITVFAVVTLGVAIMAACGNLKSLARTGQVCAPIIIILLATVIGFSAADLQKQYLLPVTYMDAGGIALAAIPIIDVLGTSVYFLFLDDQLIRSPRDKGTIIKWLAFVGVAVFLIMLTTIGTLSSEYVKYSTSPFFTMIRNTTMFGVAERIEALVVALWIMCDFMYLSAIVTIAAKLSMRVTGVKNKKFVVWPIAAVTYLTAVFISKSVFQLQIYSEWIAPIGGLILIYGVIPAILAIGKARKKI